MKTNGFHSQNQLQNIADQVSRDEIADKAVGLTKEGELIVQSGNRKISKPEQKRIKKLLNQLNKNNKINKKTITSRDVKEILVTPALNESLKKDKENLFKACERTAEKSDAYNKTKEIMSTTTRTEVLAELFHHLRGFERYDETARAAVKERILELDPNFDKSRFEEANLARADSTGSLDSGYHSIKDESSPSPVWKSPNRSRQSVFFKDKTSGAEVELHLKGSTIGQDIEPLAHIAEQTNKMDKEALKHIATEAAKNKDLDPEQLYALQEAVSSTSVQPSNTYTDSIGHTNGISIETSSVLPASVKTALQDRHKPGNSAFKLLSAESLNHASGKLLGKNDVVGKSRYTNINIPRKTAIRLRSGELMHANLHRDNRTITTQHVKNTPESLAALFEAVSVNNVGIIENLTNNSDAYNPITRAKGDRNENKSGGPAFDYWPEKGKTAKYGSLQVKTTDIKQEDGFKVVSLEIKEGSKTQKTKVFHFENWPDHGVPKGESLRQYNNYTDACDRYAKTLSPDSKTMTHCHAGVGRTGTQIMLDRIKREIDAGQVGWVNLEQKIYENLWELREDGGPVMVQTADQLQFIMDSAGNYLLQQSEQDQEIYTNKAVNKEILTGKPRKENSKNTATNNRASLYPPEEENPYQNSPTVQRKAVKEPSQPLADQIYNQLPINVQTLISGYFNNNMTPDQIPSQLVGLGLDDLRGIQAWVDQAKKDFPDAKIELSQIGSHIRSAIAKSNKPGSAINDYNQQSGQVRN